MANQEVTRFFCPFAREMCREGELLLQAEATVKCRFWHSDASRCRLLPALGGLAALNEVPGMLQSLASQRGE